MYVVYRDTIGTVRIDNVETISFLDGIAYFEAEAEDYQLWTSQIVEIGSGA